MTLEEQKKLILSFMAGQKLAVLATATWDGNPEAALVGFAEKPDLKLVFGTLRTNRKYDNIRETPEVAFVIGLTGPITVQYEGVALELSGQEAKDHQDLQIRKHPAVAKYMRDPDEKCFLVTPTWIRYVDTTDPESTFEIKF